ncbi:MAG TPA: hypothetical protein VE442_18840 [Jatrophihabitans sp.]|nr:hypothetical protein [Jatrophihabitans sp.]
MLAVAVACSSPGSQSGSESLRNGDQVESSRASAATFEGKIGQPATLGDVTLTVKGVEAGGDASGPWMVTSLRWENHSGQDTSAPSLWLYCADTKPEDHGEYQAGSTLSDSEPLPARSYKEGTLNLLLPGDSRTGTPVPKCASPATLRAEATAYKGDTAPSVTIPVPDEVIAKLNARRVTK